MNQTLLVRLLEREGHRLTVVSTGHAAISALATTHFDVALMDGQMPEMDGLAAIRSIRQTEAAERSPRLPVIALTAHSLEGDREQFLAAGFDAYVRKPILIRELCDAIARVVPPVPAAFNEGAALERVLGDADLLRELAQLFLNEAPRWLSAIRTAVEHADARALAAGAHTLKSAADHLGADTTFACACKLEELGRNGKLDEAPSVLARLEGVVADLQVEPGATSGARL